MRAPLEVVVVSGLSGSGKSTAIHVFEDLGYYCIDNLPLALLPRFLELCEQSRENLDRVALGIDVRERRFFGGYAQVLDELQTAGYRLEILFFDAADEVLVRRYSETRRPHPLSGDEGAPAGIARERRELAGLRARADRIVDTSGMTVHELREYLRNLYGEASATALAVSLISFGYKYGIPTDADMILDARFLANPFFVDGLREKSGCDPEVVAFVLDQEEAREFVRRVVEFLDFTLPFYRREGKRYLTIGIGCTGGRHRSVALVEVLAARLAERHAGVRVRHRDVER